MTAIRTCSISAHRTSLRGVLLSLACAALLQACGGGPDTVETGGATSPGSTSPPPTTTPPASTNHAPTIAGSPSATVQAGQAYTFTPSATDADSDTLSFSIANKPAWATFSSTTGQLSGTPTTAQVGAFANVTITVSDGSASASLSAFSISVAAPPVVTGSATLSWTPPTAREDGTSLSNLAGYSIHYGTSSGNYTLTISVSNPGLSTYQIDNLKSGTYYFVVTAVDALGYESANSTPVSKTIS